MKKSKNAIQIVTHESQIPSGMVRTSTALPPKSDPLYQKKQNAYLKQWQSGKIPCFKLVKNDGQRTKFYTTKAIAENTMKLVDTEILLSSSITKSKGHMNSKPVIPKSDPIIQKESIESNQPSEEVDSLDFLHKKVDKLDTHIQYLIRCIEVLYKETNTKMPPF